MNASLPSLIFQTANIVLEIQRMQTCSKIYIIITTVLGDIFCLVNCVTCSLFWEDVGHHNIVLRLSIFFFHYLNKD